MTVEPFGTIPRHEEPKRKRGRFEALFAFPVTCLYG